MTRKEFMNSVGNGEVDVLEQLLQVLGEKKIDYCLVGGLAVNAYVEPVVSLDLDVVIALDAIEVFLEACRRFFTIEKFPHSVNLNSPKSDLRIQLQTDSRYQAFIKGASLKEVMGYTMKVAKVEDVLQGKIWAYLDQKRRMSKRQKDLADIFRIIESYPKLKKLLPASIKT